MARIRSIHPDACKSEKLAAASAEAERLYWRMATHCDDEGRAEDDPVLMAAFLFPRSPQVDGDQVDVWLDELAALGLIVRYEVDGDRYLAVTRWTDYQKPRRVVESHIPSPDCGQVRAVCGQARAVDGHLSVGVGVGEGVGEGEGVGVALAKRARERDPIFDALLDAWNVSSRELTDTERGRVNRAVKLLRDIDADPAEIPARKAMFQLQWPDITATMLAVVGRWAECRPDPARLQPRAPKAASAIARAVAGGDT